MKNFFSADHHSHHCQETPEKGGPWRAGGQRYSADASETDGQETPVSDSMSGWTKMSGLSTSMNSGLMPSNSNSNSGQSFVSCLCPCNNFVVKQHLNVDTKLKWNLTIIILTNKLFLESLTCYLSISYSFKE